MVPWSELIIFSVFNIRDVAAISGTCRSARASLHEVLFTVSAVDTDYTALCRLCESPAAYWRRARLRFDGACGWETLLRLHDTFAFARVTMVDIPEAHLRRGLPDVNAQSEWVCVEPESPIATMRMDEDGRVYAQSGGVEPPALERYALLNAKIRGGFLGCTSVKLLCGTDYTNPSELERILYELGDASAVSVNELSFNVVPTVIEWQQVQSHTEAVNCLKKLAGSAKLHVQNLAVRVFTSYTGLHDLEPRYNQVCAAFDGARMRVDREDIKWHGVGDQPPFMRPLLQ